MLFLSDLMLDYFESLVKFRDHFWLIYRSLGSSLGSSLIFLLFGIFTLKSPSNQLILVLDHISLHSPENSCIPVPPIFR